MQISTEDIIMKKRSTSIKTFNFVAAYLEIYQVVEETHAAFGPGGEKQTFAKAKNMCSHITQERFKQNSTLYNSRCQPEKDCDNL